MMKPKIWSRRTFLAATGSSIAGAVVAGGPLASALAAGSVKKAIPVSAHLWVYASTCPNWDATPVLDTVFRDFQSLGYSGIELMDNILARDDAVERIHRLSTRFSVPVTGSSFGGDMWNEKMHDEIASKAEIIIGRLAQLKGRTFGISVGDAGRKKTNAELDAQASLLKHVFALCAAKEIQSNLHNHTYEVADGMHDLKGTLERLPEAKLGPDLNWLIRGGVDPVAFIQTYGKSMVYMHLRDQYRDGTWTEYLGEGVTDFPAIAKALDNVGFEGRAAVELAFPEKFAPTEPIRTSWLKSRQYLRATFGW